MASNPHDYNTQYKNNYYYVKEGQVIVDILECGHQEVFSRVPECAQRVQ